MGDWVWDLLSKIGIVVTGILGSILAALWFRIIGLTERVAMLETTIEQLGKTLPAAIANLTQELKESRKDREAQIERLYEKLDDVRLELKDDIKEASQH